MVTCRPLALSARCPGVLILGDLGRVREGRLGAGRLGIRAMTSTFCGEALHMSVCHTAEWYGWKSLEATSRPVLPWEECGTQLLEGKL